MPSELTAVLDELSGGSLDPRYRYRPRRPCTGRRSPHCRRTRRRETRNLLHGCPRSPQSVRSGGRGRRTRPQQHRPPCCTTSKVSSAGKITAREGQQYLEQIRRQTLTRPTASVAAPGAGLTLPGRPEPAIELAAPQDQLPGVPRRQQDPAAPDVVLAFPHGEVWVDNISGEPSPRNTRCKPRP